MAAKIKGRGTLLQVKPHGSGSFTTLGNRVMISGSDMEMGSTETSHIDSTFREKSPTLVDPKDFSCECWYDPNDATFQSLSTGLPVGTSFDWKVVYADGLTTPANETFTGFVKSFKPSNIKVDDYVKVEIKIELTTIVTYTAGTP